LLLLGMSRMFEQVAEVVGDTVGVFLDWLTGTLPIEPRLVAMAKHGPRNVAGDGTWITDLCASWLHESCSAREHCDCVCHVGWKRYGEG
jgi:hypothetical protein